nr:uncharacterized protein LOC112546408 [Pelodiscus sinensis]|eukprot:XP_025042422.1 uncharacterized protein LOC112546408 [Pelodiscus sinensis]
MELVNPFLPTRYVAAAPFRAPTLHPSRIWPTQVEVHWEEIPLEERGGFIRNYTISYHLRQQRRGKRPGLRPHHQNQKLRRRHGGTAALLPVHGARGPAPRCGSGLRPQAPPGPRTVPAEQGGRQRARVSDSPSHALVCGRQDKGVTTCKSFPEAAWAAEASSAGDKYRQPLQTIFAPGDVATPGRCPTGCRSKVEYSAVIVWVYPGGTPPSSGAAWPLCTPQSPESTGPSQEPGRGVCFQNPSYEALDGPCWRSGQQPDAGVASLGAFPLLRTVVGEGSGDPHPNGDHPGCTSSPVAP